MNDYAKMLIYTLLISAVMGLAVILFNSDYRPDKILLTNKTYYPNVK